jgi:GNAT superfamily N-acetyltransferase
MNWQLSSASASVQEYSHLTYPRFRPFLESRGDADPFVAVCATIEGHPSALALARVDTDHKRSAQLLSVAVAAQYRRRGAATAVLQSLEEILRGRGCRRTYATYLGDSPSRVALEATLKKSGWKTGRQRSIIGRSDVPTMRQAPWLWKLQLPSQYELFAWNELAASERGSLSHGDCPPELMPFGDENSIELNSVGLRYQGRVVGWQINHRVLPDTIRYSRLYVEPDLPRRGLGITMVAESLRRHITDQRLSAAPKGVFHLEANNMPMQCFVLRRLSPWMQSFTMSYEASKELSGGPN